MATIKSYTDLEQSKVLAKFLPLESADMHYWRKGQILGVGYSKEMQEGFESKGIDCTPCWSLATLLELLPKRIEIVDNVYKLSVYLYGIYYWNINNGNLCFESKDKDNLVDACVDMIIKLHELKML